MPKDIHIDDPAMLDRMQALIFHDGDVRPVWVGGGFATTDVPHQKRYANWANEHWGIYYSFAEEINSRSNKKVLDLGCGSGFCSANLSVFFEDSEIIASDIDEGSIAFCKEFNELEGVSFSVQDLVTCDIPQNADYIFFVEILEHIRHEHHFQIIDKLLDSLAPGGKLFISTPNDETIKASGKGHIGTLTSFHYKAFICRYLNSIKVANFIDNKRLVSDSCIIEEPTGSHYRMVLQKA
jgi:2-polyprenyl-3-methyl-5-hydroxy-6-metoxy-1,4-benzoquinol methylase